VADYSRPKALEAALTGADRLLLISGNEAGRVAQHASMARAAGVSRIFYTSMLGAGRTSSPLVGEHLDSELVIGQAGVPVTVLRNGLYLERYTDRLSEYLMAGEIVGAAGNGRISPASRQDYADTLRRAGLDETTARFVASVDSSIARGELETSSADLVSLLGRAALDPGQAVLTAYALLKARPGTD
jgi:NAD(P)H dehydrogenase (quinone)